MAETFISRITNIAGEECKIAASTVVSGSPLDTYIKNQTGEGAVKSVNTIAPINGNVTITGTNINSGVNSTISIETALATETSERKAADNTKQDIISDLADIRSGASLGATSVQPSAISDMATQTWVTAQGYLTAHQSLAEYRKSADQDIIDNEIKALIDSESQRATAKETTIETAINTEIQRAIDSESYIISLVGAEESRSKVVEAQIISLLDSEAIIRADKDTELENEIALKQDELTADEGITIDSESKISANVKDIQISGTTILSNKVANIPVATNSILGVVKSDWNKGTTIDSDSLVIVDADETAICGRFGYGSDGYALISTSNFDLAVKKAMCDEKGTTWGQSEQYNARKRIGIMGLVNDVRINGSTIIDSNGNYIANIPVASTNGLGVVKVDGSIGTRMESGCVGITNADETTITNRTQYRNTGFGAISTSNYDYAVKHALIDSEGLTYTATEQEEAKTRLGISDKVTDIQVVGTSILSNTVANIPYASPSNFGVVKLKNWNEGNINYDGNGTIYLTPQNETQITARQNGTGIINASNIDVAVKTALCADSEGLTYTSTEQEKAKARLGISSSAVSDIQISGTSILSSGVANIPVASETDLGVVKLKSLGNIEQDSEGAIYLAPQNAIQISMRMDGGGIINGYILDYAVKAALCDGVGQAYTTAEQEAAKTRLGVNHESWTFTLDSEGTVTKEVCLWG